MSRHTWNPWMVHGVDLRGRRYSRRKRVTPGNYVAGVLKIAVVLAVAAGALRCLGLM